MGHIFWNKPEIPIPENAHVNKHDGRVYFYVMNTATKRESKRKVIGHATSSTTMHPNETFKYIYPNLWEKYYGSDSLLKKQIHTGLFAASLGVGYKSGLYPILVEVFGPQSANLLMDYANYSILYKSNVSMSFPEKMASEMTFSRKVCSDTYLSSFFEGKNKESSPDEEHSWLFRDKWIEACRKRGLQDVWISIDGSNNDCDAEDCALAEKGNAKSHTNSNVVSYMYAMNAENGCPVTYLVYEGGKVDAKAFQTMAAYLNSRGIKIKGVILDRGFCTYDVFHTLDEFKTDYVIMMKSNTNGYLQMMKEHGDEIRWNVSCLSGRNGIFGISGKKQIFGSHEETSHISLFFDGANGSARIITLLNKILDEKESAEKALAEGKMPVISAALQKYLHIEKNENESCVICDTKTLQREIDSKGYSAIACSRDYTPAEVNRLYNLRDVSEKQYMITKNQLGCSVTRVHHQQGIENKFLVTFIASCIRAEFQQACRRMKLDTSRMIDEMDRNNMMLMESGSYVAIHDETERQKKLLYALDLKTDVFEMISREINKRNSGNIHSQVFPSPYPKEGATQSKPEQTESKTESKPESDTEQKRAPATPSRKGRPAGSKNKKTLEREASEAANPPAPKRPGRPLGSKNKKTLEREKQEAEKLPSQEDSEKRKGPGRPKGSKNKPKDSAPKTSRRRGRPAGSKDSYQRTRKKRSQNPETEG